LGTLGPSLSCFTGPRLKPLARRDVSKTHPWPPISIALGFRVLSTHNIHAYTQARKHTRIFWHTTNHTHTSLKPRGLVGDTLRTHLQKTDRPTPPQKLTLSSESNAFTKININHIKRACVFGHAFPIHVQEARRLAGDSATSQLTPKLFAIDYFYQRGCS